MHEVLRICQAESIDRLLYIPYQEHIVTVAEFSGERIDAIPRQKLENIILLIIGVLVLVNHDDLIILCHFSCQRRGLNFAVFAGRREQFQCQPLAVFKSQDIALYLLCPDSIGQVLFHFQNQWKNSLVQTNIGFFIRKYCGDIVCKFLFQAHILVADLLYLGVDFWVCDAFLFFRKWFPSTLLFACEIGGENFLGICFLLL